jgi:parallel beta-helix repeat protein
VTRLGEGGWQRPAAIGFLLVLATVLLAVAITGAAAVSAISTGPGTASTTVTECTVINDSNAPADGVILLGGTIANGTGSPCLTIDADDVVLDGQGHLVDGFETSGGVGIQVGNATDPTNVTIKNVRLSNWETGLSYAGTDGAVRNVTVSDSRNGLHVTGSNNTLANNDFDGDGSSGVGIAVEGTHNALDDNTATDGEYGYRLNGSHTTVSGGVVDGSDTFTTIGVDVGPAASDVTLQDVTVTDWTRSIRFLGDDGRIERVTVENVFDTSAPIQRRGVVVFGSNNTITNTGSIGERPFQIEGSNNTMTDSTSQKGVILVYGDHNRLERNVGNSTDSGSGYGVEGDYNTLANNTIVGSPYRGVHISRGSHNTIADNRLNGTSHDGIYLFEADNNTLVGNDVTDAHWYGIRLVRSSNTTISDNRADDARVNGIYSSDSTDVVVANTSVNNAGDDGISMGSAARSVVDDVTAENVGENGILVSGDSGIVVRDSTVSDTGVHGIHVVTSGETLIEGNTVEDAGTWRDEYGIYVESGSSAAVPSVAIRNNTVVDSFDNGIMLDWGLDSTVTGNEVRNPAGSTSIAGVTIKQGSSNVTVANNTLNGTQMGIELFDTDNSTVRDNHAFDIGSAPLWIQGVEDSTVTRNRLSGGSYTGIVVDGSGNTIYDNYVNNSDYVDFRGSGSNDWNVTKRAGENVVGGPYVGGNYYATPAGDGYSETCTDADADGLCDDPLAHNSGNVDALPLTDPGNSLPVPTPIPAGDWPNAGYTAAHPASHPTATDLGDTGGTVAWNRSSSLFSSRPPLVVNDTLLVYYLNGLVAAHNASTGTKKWEFQTNTTSSTRAMSANAESVFVAARPDKVYALNVQTGSVEWQTSRDDVDSSLPAYPSQSGVRKTVTKDGVVYVPANPGIAGGDEFVIALSAATGAVLWEHDEPLDNGFVVELLVDDDSGYYYTANGSESELVQIEASTGATENRIDLGSSTDRIDSQIVKEGDRLYYVTEPVGSSDSFLTSVDLTTGSIAYQQEIPRRNFDHGIAVADGVVYLNGDTWTVAAYDGTTGSELWSTYLGDFEYKTPNGGPIVVEESVYYTTFNSDTGIYSLNALDTATGAQTWNVTLPVWVRGPLAYSQQRLFTAGPGVNAVVPRTGDPEIQLSPTSIDFGEVPVDTGETRNVTVSNVGNGSLSIQDVSISGADPGVFTVESAPSTVDPGQSGTITVGFSPDSAGQRSASLDVASNDPDSGTVSVALTGNGTVVPTTGTLAGTVTNTTAQALAGASVTIENSGTAVATLTTDASGQYDIELPGNRSYTVRASLTSYYDNATTATIANGTTTTADLVLARDTVAPTAVITIAPTTVTVNESFLIDGRGSTDDTGVVAYDWDFDDGTTATGGNVTHAYTQAGEYNVTLTVTDAAGNTNATTESITVVPTAPANFTVTIDSTNSPTTEGDPLDVTATIENTGDETDSQQITLSIDGTVVDSIGAAFDGGESATLPFQWQTAAGDTGTYTAAVSSFDDTDTAIVTIQEPTVSHYANGTAGVVDVDGLLDAIDDWRTDVITTRLLLDVIDAWRSGAPV